MAYSFRIEGGIIRDLVLSATIDGPSCLHHGHGDRRRHLFRAEDFCLTKSAYCAKPKKRTENINKNTPAKHKTPNYRLREIGRPTRWDRKRNGWVNESVAVWEPMPLRAGRKDLP